MNNDHPSTTANIYSPRCGRCTQVWLYYTLDELSSFQSKQNEIKRAEDKFSMDYFEEYRIRLTIVPVKPLSELQWGGYRRFSILKVCHYCR